MKKKITIANEAGKTRLRAVEMATNGKHLLKEVAREFGVHYTTITEWCDMYQEGGVERLNAPMKPRPKHKLDAAELESILENSAPAYHERLRRLVRIANGERLKDVAESDEVSVQAIMKDRRLFEAGKLPPTVIF
jgi:transposase